MAISKTVILKKAVAVRPPFKTAQSQNCDSPKRSLLKRAAFKNGRFSKWPLSWRSFLKWAFAKWSLLARPFTQKLFSKQPFLIHHRYFLIIILLVAHIIILQLE